MQLASDARTNLNVRASSSKSPAVRVEVSASTRTEASCGTGGPTHGEQPPIDVCAASIDLVNGWPRQEMGSEFHLLDEFRSTEECGDGVVPFQGRLYANGRGALRTTLRDLGAGARRLWLPTYTCPEVVRRLPVVGELAWYHDYPDEPAPRLESLMARDGDLVLLQDTFGLTSVEQWSTWIDGHPGVTVIEDITHHCTYERFLASPAHHVFASLRKSLPVADGAILFSRAGGLVRESTDVSHGAWMKLEAMLLKRLYLQGYPVSKDEFRSLQIAGEVHLGSAESQGGLMHTAAMITTLPHHVLRRRWRHNNEV